MHKKLWNKDFILMLQGNAVSDIGDILYSVAIAIGSMRKPVPAP